jgi:hypothetical protein
MKHVSSLKPQDVALLLKVLVKGKSNWRQVDISSELEISQGEVAKSLARLRKSGFIFDNRVNRSAVMEFLSHGLKYIFPADVGALAIGIPTGISAPFFKNKIVQGIEDVYVWPSSKGNMRGQVIVPFYPQLAEAVLKDNKFYELLSLVEVLRIGRTREKKIAEEELRKRIKSA